MYRLDAWHCPLRRGSVEYMAPDSYQARPPMQPWHAFVVDVTANALSSGVTACICAAVKQAIERLASQPEARVALVAYDDRVTFLSIQGAEPRMMVMADIEVCAHLLSVLHGPGTPRMLGCCSQ
jgi:protein transport protein SEC24